MEEVEEDHSILGFYVIDNLYSLFDKPEECFNSAVFRQTKQLMVVLATGKVYKSRDYIMAIEILITENEMVSARWIHYSSLKPFNSSHFNLLKTK